VEVIAVFKTRITEMLGIEHPVLCGGMQWVSRAMTDRPFGVNISMLPELRIMERTLDFCDVVCEEAVKVVETSGRSPEPLMPKLKEAGVKVIHKVPAVRFARTAQRLGVDAVTLIGFESGSHVGLDHVASFVLIPLAVSQLNIPVIAGGSVCDGKGFLGALAMGAEAVLMGTRFFITKESRVHPSIKEKVLQIKENETSLIMHSIKNPLRCLNNRLVEDVQAMEARGTTLEELLTKIGGGRGRLAYETGDPEMSPIPCGQIAGLIDEVKSVRQVIEDIVSEAGELLNRLNGMASG
jgi:nitronate monooxygenase